MSDEKPSRDRDPGEGSGGPSSADRPDLPVDPDAPSALLDRERGGSRVPRDAAAGRATGGILTALRTRRTLVLGIAFAALFAVLGTGAVMGGHALAEGRAAAAEAEKANDTASATPSARPKPGTIAAPLRFRSCSISTLAADGRLGALEGTVIDATTGDTLFDRGGATPARIGSSMKVLTAAAALSVLGPDYRIPTTVVDAGDGTIAIVGHGDATLSALPSGQESVYPGAPKLSGLAQQAVSSWTSRHPGEKIEKVLLDASYWSESDSWNTGWDRALQTGGTVSEVTALQVDADRADPTAATSPRSDDPVAAAGAKFVAALKSADEDAVADDVQTASATAPTGSTEIAKVQSQPVSQLVPQMLQLDDATLAEMMGRLVSKRQGDGGSAASLTATYATALAKYGVATAGLTVTDGSGLSAADAASAVYLARLAVQIEKGDDQLALIREQLGRSGQSGSLATRYAGTSAAAGAVQAHSGGGAGVRTLVGTVQAADGTQLAFAFLALGDGVTTDADPALDALAVALHDCGANLSSI
ncbi:D-alanyl-D-alanine carboxypeptidase [Schumannella sp. 10F1B-5-1]|uniref:D-alanyl-D-alanine carboxypeptidase n=1 Tax=Schumannella sp. 10F1B-5-1 TaxID=2590780 RepID=UPI00112FDB73|nr:D-alanyl-D-alanine carboxypeptidase [Schumannella sp. 10F1B-5-1]TPW73489.1 D-alanyl-D-alanine carboxypeptidase/D-alanyl-D-alanine-endopeptidase [Schumannella sp. 10F1B-5-1]